MVGSQWKADPTRPAKCIWATGEGTEGSNERSLLCVYHAAISAFRFWKAPGYVACVRSTLYMTEYTDWEPAHSSVLF